MPAKPRFLRDSARMLWCLIGAVTAIVLALVLVDPPRSPFLFASLGGSSMFLFGLTRAPAAQPRALFGGHLGSALIGVLCYQLFGDALWVYALAQGLALSYMLLTKTLHPPAGANPLIMIYSHADMAALWCPVFIGIFSLALVAFIWSRIIPGTVRYPAAWLDKSPPSTFWGSWSECNNVSAPPVQLSESAGCSGKATAQTGGAEP